MPDEQYDYIPPQDLDAERSVLGSCLVGGRDVTARAIDAGLDPKLFHYVGHRFIARAILRVFDATEAPDIVTVSDALRRLSAPEDVGGAPYLSELSTTVAVADDTRPWIAILKEHAGRRGYLQAAHDIHHAALDMETPFAVMQEMAEAKVFGVAAPSTARQAEPIRSITPRARERADGYRRGIVPGVKTGFPEIDERTGGLQDSDLTVIAGRPSMGKSALAFGIALNTARRGHRPLMCLLETDREQACERMACMESSTCMLSLRSGKLSTAQHQAYTEALDRLDDLPITLDDNAGLTVAQIRSRVMRTQTDLLIVDYLQLMSSKGRSRHEEVGEVSRGLKNIAKEFRIPVVALSQLSRVVMMRKPPRPQLSDLKESGNIEQDTDTVLLIYRPTYYGYTTFSGKKDGESAHGKAEIIIAKQRNGPTGRVKLAFVEKYARFGSLATDAQQQAQQQELSWYQR